MCTTWSIIPNESRLTKLSRSWKLLNSICLIRSWCNKITILEQIFTRLLLHDLEKWTSIMVWHGTLCSTVSAKLTISDMCIAWVWYGFLSGVTNIDLITYYKTDEMAWYGFLYGDATLLIEVTLVGILEYYLTMTSPIVWKQLSVLSYEIGTNQFEQTWPWLV